VSGVGERTVKDTKDGETGVDLPGRCNLGGWVDRFVGETDRLQLP